MIIIFIKCIYNFFDKKARASTQKPYINPGFKVKKSTSHIRNCSIKIVKTIH